MIATTEAQDAALTNLAYCKVTYRNMFMTEGELGYTSRKRRGYDINIASDIDSYDVKDIVLIHEIGHVFLGHMDINHKQEMLNINDICKKIGVPFRSVFSYGGPMRFLNVAMDLEVNNKLLTSANVRTMKDFNVEPCTCEGFNIDPKDTFRDYYEPLLRMAKDKQDENKNDGEGEDEGDGDSDNFKGGHPIIIIGDNGFGDDLPGIPEDFDLEDAEIIELPVEIEDSLREEGYYGGDQKSSKDNKSIESTVGEIADDMDKSESERKEKDNEKSNNLHKLLDGGKSCGWGYATSNVVNIRENSSKEIKKFISGIIKKSSSISYQHDSLKHYNRGTRKNPDGILYNSIKRKISKDGRKLGILIDVSGSMCTDSIIKALSSLKDSIKLLDRGSKVLTWTTHKVESFLATQIPESVCTGGGTRLYPGVESLIEDNFTDIIIYSDFALDNYDKARLAEIQLDHPNANFYSIITDSTLDDVNNMCEFLEHNKKRLFLK